MVLIRCVIVGIVLLMIAFLGAGFILPDTFAVERSLIIDKPIESVYSFVSDLTVRHRWDPLAADSTVSHSFTIREQGVGSSWQWESQRSVSGTFTVEEIVTNEFIRGRLAIQTPETLESVSTWLFEERGQSTLVTWKQEGRLEYPIGRIMGYFIEDIVGPDLVQGLHRLDKALEI